MLLKTEKIYFYQMDLQNLIFRLKFQKILLILRAFINIVFKILLLINNLKYN